MASFTESLATAILLIILAVVILHAINGTLFSTTDSNGNITKLGWLRSKGLIPVG